MAWPVDAPYQLFLSGTTVITDKFLGAVQSGITSLYGGTRSVVSLYADASGFQTSPVSAGDIKAAGNVTAGLSLIAGNNLTVSSGTAAAPHYQGTGTATILAGGAAGSGSSTSGSAVSDAAGFIALTPRNSQAPGTIATVTFGTAYGSGYPRGVVLLPANELAARIQSGGGAWANLYVKYAGSSGGAGFDVVNDSLTALVSGSNYQWRYAVIA